MHIWVISQYFKPEPEAASARLSGFARIWTEMGHQVSVITSQPNHPQGQWYEGYAKKPKITLEEMEGYTVARHKYYISKEVSFTAKARSQFSFARTILKQHKHFSKLQKPDIILVSSPTLFSVWSAWRLAKKYNVPFIFEVRELWPAIFKELNIIRNKKLLGFIEKLELFLYKKANAIVTLSKGFARNIAERGTPPNKLYIITNGVNDDDWQNALKPTQTGTATKLAGQLQINNMTKVMLYIGTHGHSQSLGQIIDAARTMMQNSEVLFLFVGDGADKTRLESLAKGMPNVQFLPSTEKDRMWDFYNLAYACFVPLKDIEFFKTFIPSKMFEIMATGKPIIAMVEGEAAEILKTSRGAIVCPPERPEILAEEIEKLASNPSKAAEMGQLGRRFVREYFSHSVLARKYITVMEKVISTHNK